MSELLVYVAPSDTAEAWLTALNRRAAELTNSLDGSEPSNRTTFTTDFEVVSRREAGDLIVIWSGLESYWRHQPALPIVSGSGPEVLTSRRLASLADLIIAGATVVDGRAAMIDLPTMGPIHRLVEGGGVLDVEKNSDAPSGTALAMFASMPPVPGSKAVWPLEMFIDGGGAIGPTQAAEVNLTGRSRYIFFGPYFDLPRGHWGVTFRFRFEGQKGVKPRLSFDWGSQSGFVTREFDLGASGWYQITLQRTWRQIEHAEFRLQLLRPNFHGSLFDCQVVVERLPDTADAYLARGPLPV